MTVYEFILSRLLLGTSIWAIVSSIVTFVFFDISFLSFSLSFAPFFWTAIALICYTWMTTCVERSKK